MEKLKDYKEKILFISIHRYDAGTYYPGCVEKPEKSGDLTNGKFIINIPWNTQDYVNFPGDDEYLSVF